MADWSPTIANEFIRLGAAAGIQFTQMQLQKLVYIAHGWNLAINGTPLTCDNPEAWDYGPVYKALRRAVRHYGQDQIGRLIANADYMPGSLADEPDEPATASLTAEEQAVVERVFRDYHGFHAFQLSALTHQAGTPWTKVYDQGRGKFQNIPPSMIKEHFVELAAGVAPAPKPLTLDAIDTGVAIAEAKSRSDAQDALERKDIENEALRLRNRYALARIKSAKADRKMRQQYARRILCYLEWYSGVVGILVLLSGFKAWGFSIDQTVLGALVGSTAVAAIGLVGFIARGLFGPPEADVARKD